MRKVFRFLPRHRHIAVAYGVVAGSVGAATLVRHLLDPALGAHLPFVTYFVAILFVAWFTSLWPSIAALLLGAFAANFFFLPPRYAWGGTPFGGIEGSFSLAMYFTAGSAIVAVCEAMKAAERRAAMREDLLRVTLASIGDAVITTDPDSRITSLNPVAETLVGWKQHEAKGRSLKVVFRIIDEVTRQPVEDLVKQVLTKGTAIRLADHTVLIARDGTERPIDDSSAAIRDATGKLIGVVVVFRDIGERRRAERAIKESEARKTATLETALDCIISIDREGKIIEFNPASERTFGHRREDVLGREMADLIIPPELREPHRRGMARYLATGVGPALNRRIEMSALRADGSEFPVELTITRIPTDGPPIFTGYLRDITERRLAEQARAEQTRLMALRADVSTALASTENTRAALQQCTEALVRHLSVAFARIWTLNEAESVLEMQASAGLYTHLDGPHSRIKAGDFKIGRIASSRQPHLTNAVTEDSNISNRDWAIREGMVAFAGYPLLIEGRCVGVTAMFARRPLSEVVFSDLAPLAEAIAQYIDRKRAEEALQESVERFRMAQRAAGVGVWEFESVSGRAQWSEGCHRIYGTDPAVFTPSYERWLARILPQDRESAHRAIQEAIAQGTTFDFEFRVEHPQRGLRWIQEIGQTYTARDGTVQRMAGITLDITDRKQSEEELREADRRKNEFLAMLAHELRNPLAPLRNMLEIMKRADGDAGLIHQARQTMERQLGQMVRLVDDLLDVSRISRGTIQLHVEQVELASVVHHAVETARALCEGRNQQLSVTLPPQPIYLNADSTRLAQVLDNLLNNACKFTQKGGMIRLIVEHEGPQVLIRIQDTGRGIAPGQLPRIFEMFTQLDTSLERSHSGLGIGLTLVKNIVELHGGSVEAHSAGLGRGSEFLVRLPVLVEPSNAPPPTTSNVLEATTSPRRILVVDDNRDSADSIAMLLKLKSHQVHIAYDGLEAVEAAAKFQPEIILLDIGLPRLNGYEAARRIRERAGNDGLLLVALTGWGQEEDRRRSQEAGFDAHLVKPVAPDAITKLLTDFFQSS